MQLRPVPVISIIAAKFAGDFVSIVHAITNVSNGQSKLVELTRDELLDAARDGVVLRTIVNAGYEGDPWQRLSVFTVQGTRCLQLTQHNDSVDDLGDARHI